MLLHAARSCLARAAAPQLSPLARSLFRPSLQQPLLRISAPEPRAASLLFVRNLASQAKMDRATAVGTTPNVGMRKYKPTHNGLRHRFIVDKRTLWPGRPVKSLTERIVSRGGRCRVTGQITIRGREARKHRQLYRKVDFHRTRQDPAVVKRFEYDPNRSAFIALIEYESDEALSYILAPQGLKVGDTVQSGDEVPYAPGNAMPLAVIPDGTLLHNIELIRGMGGKMVRSAGTSAKLQSKEARYALLKLQSNEIRKVKINCLATIGQVSNSNHHNRVLGKAGASRWIGRRPKVRGVAMNAVDHPMGGGEGRSSGGGPSRSPWGWYTKGIRTRKKMQPSSKLIVRRRNHDKLGLSNINRGRGSW